VPLQKNKETVMKKPFFAEIASSIYLLKVPMGELWTGVYLVRRGRNILIDSGCNAQDVDDVIVPALEQTGLTVADIGCLLCTHTHGDHIGGHARLKALGAGTVGVWAAGAEKIRDNLFKIADLYAPLLTLALEAAGGIKVADLFAEGLLAGDEEHTRQWATDRNLLSLLIEPVSAMRASDRERLELLRWLNSCKRFVHHVGCASAVAALKSAANVPGSSLVTAMCGNGYEFGIKTSGTGERWFTAPAPSFHGHYWSPEWTDADSSPWLGDSSNV